MFLPVQVPLVSDEIRAEYQVPTGALTLLPALVRPWSRGYLRLRSAEPDSPLELQPNFLQEPADIDAPAAGYELGLEIASQPAYRDLVGKWIAPAKRLSRSEAGSFVRRASSTYHHPVGTCAMGAGPDAVVDAELRVRGIQGLRIADASVMPTIPSAGTHAPSVMIGEFASRLVVAEQLAFRSRRAVHSPV
jgi:choline dehydrogenase